MLFSILCPITVSIHISIDFGSFMTKSAAFIENEPPHILTNLDAKRLTPTFISFYGPKLPDYDYCSDMNQSLAQNLEPQIGMQAIHQLESRPWMGTGFLPQFVDATSNYTNIFTEKYFLSKKAACLEYLDVLPIYFRYYINEIAKGNQVESVTLAVPAYFTVPQRQIIKKALNIAGYSIVQIVDDVNAVATFFGFERFNQMKHEKPMISLFIDVGAVKSEAYAVNFSLTRKGHIRAERLTYSYNHCGSADITAKIADIIADEYNMKLTRSEMRRIFDAAEKIKNMLTVSQTAEVTIENINGQDRVAKFNKKQIDNIAKRQDKCIQGIIKAAKPARYDEINIIGGGTRVNAIQDMFLKHGYVRKQLNADETIALGASYISQQKRKQMLSTHVEVYNKFQLYSVTIDGTKERIGECTKGRLTSSVKYSRRPTRFLTFTYGKNQTQNTNTTTFKYKLEKRMNSSVIHVNDAPFEPSIITDNEFNQIEFAYQHTARFNPSVFNVIVSSDEDKRRIANAISLLEHKAHATLHNLESNQTYREYTNQSTRLSIVARCRKIIEWTQLNINNASLLDVEEQQSYLAEVLSPLEKRLRDTEIIDQALAVFLQSLEIAESSLETIPVKEKRKLSSIIQENQKWYNIRKDIPVKLDKQRPLTPADLMNRARYILNFVNDAKGIKNTAVDIDESEELSNILSQFL